MQAKTSGGWQPREFHSGDHDDADQGPKKNQGPQNDEPARAIAIVDIVTTSAAEGTNCEHAQSY